MPADSLPESETLSSLETLPETDSFKISPLIQLTLMAFYTALVIPLPFLAQATQAPIPVPLLWAGAVLGAAALWGGLSERVEVNAEGIAVTYPAWVRAFGRQGFPGKGDQNS